MIQIESYKNTYPQAGDEVDVKGKAECGESVEFLNSAHKVVAAGHVKYTGQGFYVVKVDAADQNIDLPLW